MQPAVTFDLTYYPVSVVSCMFFLAIFKYVSPSISSYLCPKFRTLPAAKQVYWHTSVNSSLHAVITSAVCIYTFINDDKMQEEPVWNDSISVRASCAIVVGYMTADAIIMMCKYSQIGDPYNLLHHAASVYAYYYVMTYGTYVYFANFRLLAELSTPWVNNRWFLDVMGQKHTKVYLWNGVLLTAVFLACRIMTMPYCWYKIFTIYGTEPYLRTGYIQYVLLSSCFVLDILNVFWFYKLLKGVHKTLSSRDNNKNNLVAQKEE